MSDVIIHIRKTEEFSRFLNLHDFEVTDLGEGVVRVVRGEELPVFISVGEESLYFQVDLGNVSEIANENLYFQLLDLNTEVQPVSFGINNSNPDDPRLVLVESRERGDLNDHEILSVFDALELAVDRAEELLAAAIA